MPINKLRPTRRAALALAAITAMTIGGYVTLPTGEKVPPAVAGAAEYIAGPWEGLRTLAYWDADGKVWTLGYGETKGVKKGDRCTPEQCLAMLIKRLNEDFWPKITSCAPRLLDAPLGVQIAMLGGAYNFGPGDPARRGTGGWCNWNAAANIRAGNWQGACEAQTAINKAGGRVLAGLVARREMGDAKRLGEGEICVTGVQMDGKVSP